VSKALAELQSGSGGGADRLRQMSPVAGRKTEVVGALTRFLNTSNDDGARQNAVRALALWGGKDSVLVLTAKLQDKNLGVRNAAIEALADLKDARAAHGLARLLPTIDGDNAAKALRQIGSAAEPAVWPYLRYEEKDDTKKLACNLVEEIGTNASITHLQTLIRRDKGSVKEAAIKARDAIRMR
jgi:HEAT repeat protein